MLDTILGLMAFIVAFIIAILCLYFLWCAAIFVLYIVFGVLYIIWEKICG